MMQLEQLALKDLHSLNYSVVGNGGFMRRLLELLQIKSIAPPRYILSTNNTTGMIHDIPIVLLENVSLDQLTHVVLGSDVFQIELMSKVDKIAPDCRFIDVADEVQSSNLNITPFPLARKPNGKPYVLFVALAHSGPMRLWLENFSRWLDSQGLSIVAQHPLSSIDDSLIQNAAFLLIWNGATQHFEKILQQAKRLNQEPTYIECGFFPQLKHFYFDRNGVNLDSQLMKDKLDWLNDHDLMQVKQYRQALFGNIPHDTDDDYIFIPLQIESDSNIQLHSRFQHGMQEYIDFIASQHPEQRLVFKPHPKDTESDRYNTHHGIISHDDTLTLIAHSSLVRGINSSVLFEAALFGKLVLSDGESLLNHPCGDHQRIIAAMLARQYQVDETHFHINKLSRFSHMGDYFEQ